MGQRAFGDFLTLVPPFNTVIVILRLNEQYRDLLSNDLGAIGGFLFDVGSGRYPLPPASDDASALKQWEADVARVRAEAAEVTSKLREQDRTHTDVQAWLRDLGQALEFDVWIAANDQGRLHDGKPLGDGCRRTLPVSSDGAEAVRLIDVLWLDRATDRVAAAFEVEHTTSIYSGIVRLLDLACGSPDVGELFIVAPDDREDEVRAQLRRPAFRAVGDLRVRFLPYGELETHRASIARFGSGLKPISALARSV